MILQEVFGLMGEGEANFGFGIITISEEESEPGPGDDATPQITIAAGEQTGGEFALMPLEEVTNGIYAEAGNQGAGEGIAVCQRLFELQRRGE